MSSLYYLLKRLGWSVFVLIGLSILIFTISRIVPGDPARMALGSRAPDWAVERLRQEMHLRDPIYVQYAYWVKGVVSGDFGESLMTRRPVLEDVKDYLPATLELVFFAGILQIGAGFLFGVISSANNNTWLDSVVRIIAYIGVVTPTFVFAIVFLLLFAYGTELFPAIGRIDPGISVAHVTGFLTIDSLISGNIGALLNSLKHLVLPAVSLAMPGLSQIARITRSAMVDNMEKDYVLMVEAQGLPRSLVFGKYLLRPASIPAASIMALQLATMVSNAFLVELIFGWPGLSSYGVNAMLQKDLNAIIAVVLIIGLMVVVLNIVTDIIVSLLDPRVVLGGQTSA